MYNQVMSRNIFITATGTDVGKTYVSALIVKKMRESGFNCGYFKPVLSGVTESNGRLIESDCNYVIDTANIPTTADDCVAYWWKEAVSPHLAAERIGNNIDIQKITKKFEEKNDEYNYLLIEGAGGITCPLKLNNGEKYLLKDLIKELNTNIIIVADGGLGTINSTLLTAEYAKNHNIKIEGIILNHFDPDNFMHQDNLKQVEYLTGIKVIATVKENQKDIDLLEKYFV